VSDEQPQNPRAPKAKAQKTGDWVLQAADTVLAFVGERRPIVCASGISPSGPIHLGNLREVMTTHLVAEELRRRGHEVIHHHSWDDFDRLRKVPANIDPSFVQHIGRPIAEIPDPFGEYDSWATRFITEFEQACARLGIQPRWVRQSKMYRAGAYVEGIRTALRRRFEIFRHLGPLPDREAPRQARRGASRRVLAVPGVLRGLQQRLHPGHRLRRRQRHHHLPLRGAR
jgi:lysyl-tRNA synthetase class 1